MIRYSVITITLPGPNQYGINGWCFSTEHDSCVEGSVPCTHTLGNKWKTIQDIYDHMVSFRGPLVFNPIKEWEPDYSAEYIDIMKEYTLCSTEPSH